MRTIKNKLGQWVIGALTLMTLMSLAFVIYFIIQEALPLFAEVSLSDFLLGDRWMPIAFTGEPSFGIRNFLLGTLYVSFLAMAIASVTGIGAAIWLACVADDTIRNWLYPLISLLAGIPSVIFGLIGLTILVPFFYRLGVHPGSCVLCAAIVLAVMLLPYIISSCADTLYKLNKRYLTAATGLGVTKWYAITTVILPLSVKYLATSLMLAIGRAMGETMAVMMVMGNANLFPSLLGKGETIAAVIALEMGTAENGSLHYHGLYAAGLVLLLLLFFINLSMGLLRKVLLGKEEL